MNPDGMIALLNFREDGITPYFTFWSDGMKEQKLVCLTNYYNHLRLVLTLHFPYHSKLLSFPPPL